MLKLLVGLLVAANLVFFAFTCGWLDGVLGLHAGGDREPARLAAQVRPQIITLLPPASGASTAVVSTACYEAGPFGASDGPAVEAVLQAVLAPGSWTVERTVSPPGGTAGASSSFRVAAADAALAAQLTAMKLAASGRGFSPCASPTPGR